MIGLLLVALVWPLTADGLVQLLPATALIIVCIVALIALFRTRPNDSTLDEAGLYEQIVFFWQALHCFYSFRPPPVH